MKKIRAIGYTRVSTEEQAKEGYSLDNQERDIRRFCDYKEWELVEMFSDEGISGATVKDRPGIINALSYLKEEDIDYIIVWKLSRLSRSMRDIVDIADIIEKKGKYLCTIQDNIDTANGNGKHFLYFAAIFAEFERDSMIIQVKGGMEQKARVGEWNGGTPPLGYDLKEKKLVINKEESPIVELMYNEYLAGNGYMAIVDDLKGKGYKSKKGFDFSATTVKEILKNPTYKGWVRWGYRKDWGKKNEEGSRKREYSDEPIYVKGIHDAIVDEVKFEEVQALIMNNPRSHMRRYQGFHLLSGLLRCPDCGYGMSIQQISSKGRKYSYYSCNQYQNKKLCKPNMISKDKIEEEFLGILDKIVSESSFKETMKKSVCSADAQLVAIDANIKRKEAEIEKLEKDINEYMQELNGGTEKYKERIRKIIEDCLHKEEEIEKVIQNEKRKRSQVEAVTLDVDDIFRVLEHTGKVIRLLEKEAQQNLIRKLIRQIKVKDKHISEMEFTFGEVLELNEERGTVP